MAKNETRLGRINEELKRQLSEIISYELKEIDAVDHLNIKKVDKIFILYDVYTVEMANKVKTKIEEKIKQS